MSKETLVCQSCQRSWQREHSRGRKPRFCYNCQVTSDDLIKPSKIVIKDDTLLQPAIKHIDTVVKKQVKYKGKNSWICPKCSIEFQTFVGLIDNPMHVCRKSSNKYLPYELVRQEAQT